MGPPAAGGLAGSRWAETVHGHRGGQLPDVDAPAHAAVCELVRDLVTEGLVDGVHDVSDGGLGLALAEMAVRSETGFDVQLDGGHAALFSEAPSRAIVCVPAARVAEVTARAGAAGVTVGPLGRAGGDRLVVRGLVDVALGDALDAWARALPGKLQLLES